MGATWCEIHDVSGKIKVCPHIQSYVSAETGRKVFFPVSTLREIEAVTILFSQFLLFPEPLVAYCSICAKQRNLPTGNKMLLIKLLIKYRGFIYLHKNNLSECAICFYKQILQVDCKNTDMPVLTNKTTKVSIPK